MKQRKILAFLTAGVAAGALTAGGAFAQGLSGKVTSEAEPVMEGVLVSARKAGSTITHTVVTDASGKFDFAPAAPAAGPPTCPIPTSTCRIASSR